jgi:hypothetical protein
MIGFARRIAVGVGILALLTVPLAAQENLDQGKTGAQLYASDCAICHKSPQGLTKKVGLFGLADFLREHYTASRESAASIAAYVNSTEKAAAPAPRHATTKRNEKGKAEKKAKSETGAKPDVNKAGEGKAKAKEAKPEETKSKESKPAESKPAESKPAESKPGATKSGDAKPAEPKAGEAKSEHKSEHKPAPKAEAKSETKSETKPAKPD